jgi:hypothetical protein
MLGLNIFLEKPLDALHRRPGFKVSDFEVYYVSEKKLLRVNINILWEWKECVRKRENRFWHLL